MLRDSCESPISKNKFKDITKYITDVQKTSSFETLLATSLKQMMVSNVPQKVHWRVYLEIADFAKREARFDEAKFFYKLAITNQPYAYQGWLEYSKMEEESGNQDSSLELLMKGLKFNPFSENLFIKMVKIEEKR
jgi:tetratricopeptide (TPR) repeat protein